jgi:hypothetical protein
VRHFTRQNHSLAPPYQEGEPACQLPSSLRRGQGVVRRAVDPDSRLLTSDS